MTLEILNQVLGFNWGGVLWVGDDKLSAEHYTGIDIPHDWPLPLNGSGITVRAAQTGATQHVSDTRDDPDYVPSPKQNIEETLSELATPVIEDGSVVAVLDVQSFRTDYFSDDDKRLLEILAQHVASAMHRLKDENKL